ncbi:MAG: DUF4118 domain-containing protein [Caldilineaceae bacterium]|nr:DUF4118 domain-containing protein [Caldilineaceae bacterium]
MSQFIQMCSICYGFVYGLTAGGRQVDAAAKRSAYKLEPTGSHSMLTAVLAAIGYLASIAGLAAVPLSATIRTMFSRPISLARWQWSWRPLVLIGGLLIVTLLHSSIVPGISRFHTVYRYFYFLPIVYAALRLGFWGGLFASLAATLAFAPYILFSWGDVHGDTLNDLLVIPVFFGVALITGATVEQLRAAEAHQAQTARQLADSLRQLEAQGEELRRAERLSSLGTLAGGLAHEIRNPVGIIRASAQLISLEYGERVAESVAVILQESDRVDHLIENLLNYADGEQLQRRETDIAVMLAQVQERILPLTRAAGVEMVVEVASPLPTAYIDGEQVEQALVNLCMNAIQALDGPGAITLAACVAPEAKDALLLWVGDNGPGIPPEQQTQVFDPFFSTKDRGTGLGLSVVQRIVTKHAGRIWVESTCSIGTTFIIRLPLHPPTAASLERPAHA